MPEKSHRKPRGRAVLVWALVSFIAMQLSTSVILDYGWPQVRFPMFYDRVSQLDALAKSPTVIFLGSSRTQSVLNAFETTRVIGELTGDPRVSCFNASVPAGDPILCERMLRRLLEHGARPRLAVIEVCPEGINARNAWLDMYVAWILRWDDIPAYGRDLAVTGNLVRYAGTRLIPLYVYRDQIRRQFAQAAVRLVEEAPPEIAPMPVTCTSNRAVLLGKWQQSIAECYRDCKPDPERTKQFVVTDVQRAVSRYRPGGNGAAALESILRLCQTHGIEPILISVPLSTNHRQCYTSEIESAFQAHVAAIRERYPCRYFDYRTALPDSLFVDHHHAAPDGGLLFSRKLAVEVLAPTWSGLTSHE